MRDCITLKNTVIHYIIFRGHVRKVIKDKRKITGIVSDFSDCWTLMGVVDELKEKTMARTPL